VHSAYRITIEARKNMEDYYESRASYSDFGIRQKEWEKLWGMKLSILLVPCTKFFTKSYCVKKNRNMTTTAECKICGANEDT
jgi:hypothetical protein